MSTEILHYKAPSRAAFHCRQVFYSCQREQIESNEKWFRRIEECVDGCDFGTLSNFMLIDKFLSGLSLDAFEKFCYTQTVTVERLLAIASSERAINVVEQKIEPTNEIDQFLAMELCDAAANIESSGIKFDDNFDGSFDYDDTFNATDREIEVKPLIKANDSPVVELPAKELDHAYDLGRVQLDLTALNQITVQEIKGYTEDNQNRILCLDCGKVFKHKSTYSEHRKLHTGDLLPCKFCNKKYTKPGKLKKHLLSHEHDGKSFECYFCKLQCDRFKALKIHFGIKHPVTQKVEFSCTYCPKVYYNQKSFNVHIRVHEGLKQLHKCPECSREFERLENLKAHMAAIHSDFKQFVCETCGHGSKTKQQMKVHMQKHSDEKPFKCDTCGAAMKHASTYKDHLRIHTGERPFGCEICLKTFNQKTNLRKHLKLHRDDKPHPCSMCEKRFATKHHLRSHMNVHLGEKTFKCLNCDKVFSKMCRMRHHMKRVHGIMEAV